VKRISSKQTAFMKKVLPFLLVAAALVPAVALHAEGRTIPLGAFAPAILIAIVLAFIFPRLVWGLADEVYDGGDYLLVKRGRLEDRIALADIMNVSVTMMVNPPRITLRLVRPGKFGDEVSFAPVKPMTLNPFARSAIADDLITRVDAARVKRARP
jgi:hypothetical protein